MNLEKFKAYFSNNGDFWRAFKNKEVFLDLPKNATEKKDLVAQVFDSIRNKTYYPSTPIMHLTRNKGNGVSRVIPVFSIKDYCVYYYCIKVFEEKIAYNRVPNTFGGWTLGGVIRESEESEMAVKQIESNNLEDLVADFYDVSLNEYSFNPLAWIRAYGDMNAKLYATAKSNSYKYVAELDVANFYDSIRLDILELRIREIADKQNQEEISLLFHFLNYWNRRANLYNRQVVGLPQDAMADCSRILANFYLQSYDEKVYELCIKEGAVYFRYADDQFIFADSKEKLKFIIFKISQDLNYFSLNINQKKVSIRTTEELISHRSFEIFDILAEQETRDNRDSVEHFVDRMLDVLNEGEGDALKGKGNPLLSRALFCSALRDIEPTKKDALIKYYFDESYLENVKSKHFGKIYDLLSEGEKKLFIQKLENLSEKLFHNAFHYEVISFFDNLNLNTDKIKKRIKDIEEI